MARNYRIDEQGARPANSHESKTRNGRTAEEEGRAD
jgi:hypothetical protein